MPSQHPTDTLTVHHSLRNIPMPAEADPASRAIVASVCHLGITTPLKICKGRVVDGRLRLRGASAAGLATVPVEEVDEEDVVCLILHGLLARTHYSKSALAYLAYPLFEPSVAETRKRTLSNFKTSGRVVSASKTAESTEWTPRGMLGNTAEEIAASLGVSRSLFFMAREIHKKFNSGPKLLRNEWEPKILSGEMGLGEVQQAIAGKLAALAGDTHPKGDPQQLLFALFKAGAVRFARWSSLSAAQRKAASDKFRTEFLPSLPDDLLDIVDEFITSRTVK